MEEDNIVYLNNETSLDIPVERVLKHKDDLKTVVMVGWTEDGGFYASSSTPDVGEVLFLIETLKMNLLNGAYSNDESD